MTETQPLKDRVVQVQSYVQHKSEAIKYLSETISSLDKWYDEHTMVIPGLGNAIYDLSNIVKKLSEDSATYIEELRILNMVKPHE